MSVMCRHFGSCGGCAFQDLSPEDYRALKRSRVVTALARHAIDAPIAPLAETAPGTRRRASLGAARYGDRIFLGFNARRSHEIVDMQECLVLSPAILSIVQDLREVLRRLLQDAERAEVSITETDSGLDLTFALPANMSASDVALLAQWAGSRNVARILVNGEVAVQLATPVVRIGETGVALPAGTFLQPSREGERILQYMVLAAMAGARRIADLFAGCGTFALLLAKSASVLAVDMDRQALDALRHAARSEKGLKPVSTEARDLFRRPLRPEELDAFDGVVIDPPRAGASAQVTTIGQSHLGQLVYVSCNPDSFARDAAILMMAGFSLGEVTPVDQFLWSEHIELIGTFERKRGWSRRPKN